MYPASSKFYTHNSKSLFGWYVWFLSMISFSIPRTFTLRSILPTPVILRGAEGEVAESMFQQITLTLREKGVPSQTLVEGRARAISPKLLIALTGTERQGEGFPSLFEM